MCMCMRKDKKSFNLPTLSLGNTNLNFVDHCKYLGTIIHIDKTDLDVRRQTRKFYGNANMLLRKFSKCSNNVKSHLFSTYCSNLYCAPFWYATCVTKLNKLKVSYNNSFRRLMKIPYRNSASAMFVNNGVISFKEMLRKNIYNFMCRIQASKNTIISSIIGSCHLLSTIWTWWRKILYTSW